MRVGVARASTQDIGADRGRARRAPRSAASTTTPRAMQALMSGQVDAIGCSQRRWPRRSRQARPAELRAEVRADASRSMGRRDAPGPGRAAEGRQRFHREEQGQRRAEQALPEVARHRRCRSMQSQASSQRSDGSPDDGLSIAPTAVRRAPIIRMEGVDKWYGKFQVLNDIDLDGAHAASASSSAGRRARASRR